MPSRAVLAVRKKLSQALPAFMLGSSATPVDAVDSATSDADAASFATLTKKLSYLDAAEIKRVREAIELCLEVEEEGQPTTEFVGVQRITV